MVAQSFFKNKEKRQQERAKFEPLPCRMIHASYRNLYKLSETD